MRRSCSDNRQWRLLLCAIVMAACTDTIGAEQPAALDGMEPRETFLVFDGTLYRNRPDLRGYGLRPIHIIYASSLWPAGVSRDEPLENSVRARARQAHRRGELVCIDIEHWPVRNVSDEEVEHSVNKYARVADWMHDAAPDLRLGFYGVLPIRDYWIPVKGTPERLGVWHAANARLDGLARHVDVVFPSLYAPYDDPDDWVTYAKANLSEARRYHKQVYVFLMPYYHPSNEELEEKPISSEFWRLQLETCRQYADGIVIWGGYQKEWDGEAEWWQVTQQFMRAQVIDNE